MALAEHINSAHRVLKQSFKAIPGLFTNKEIRIMDYMSKNVKNKAIEIRFDTATLTCLFDKNDVCKSAYLFLDVLSDLPDYIVYCNETYDYNFLLSGWMIGNYCFHIKQNQGDFFFVLMPVSATLDEPKRNGRAECLAV